MKLIIHLYLILKISVQQPSNNIYFLIYFSDLARIKIFKGGSLINEIKEKNMNFDMINSNNIALINSIIRINPIKNNNINNIILNDKIEDKNEKSNEDIDFEENFKYN